MHVQECLDGTVDPGERLEALTSLQEGSLHMQMSEIHQPMTNILKLNQLLLLWGYTS